MKWWLIIVGLVIFGIILLKLKDIKHRLLFFVAIIVIIFLVVASFGIFRNHDVDVTSFGGAVTLGKLYVSSLVNFVENIAGITGYAAKQDWGVNASSINILKKG